jgi:two-component system, NarL family, response regulator DegU
VGAQPEHPGSGYRYVRAYRGAGPARASDAAPRRDVGPMEAAVTDGGANSATAITAVLADAYPLWLEAVERVLRPLEVSVAGKATSSAEAVELLEQLEPALLVTDLHFGKPDEGGIPYLKQALAVCPDVKVIVLATFEESQMVADAIAAGARAYALKHVLPADLAAAVRQVFHHSIFFAPDDRAVRVAATETELVLPLPEGAATARVRTSTEPQLTRRELEILTLVADGLPNAEIARRLWITEQTVKFHLSNIYRKLGVSNRTQASRWAVLQEPTANR